ncbi:Glycosyltransferase [Mesorhizobium prunaredense]|uniref:Glycosyltransferase n=1 Tax=Mesorhizobium prunaredense TaxID=1631249 RepID=A0A1R3VIB2_9HYPH|nr:glycosyltransferase family 1 protein [Mesorhizobium prunaredense]SIT58139.1 Glycosyltransferase [Mesorhizobium prunaredense]
MSSSPSEAPQHPTGKRIAVTQFMRRPVVHAYSVERIFEDARKYMPSDCDVSLVNCKYPSLGIAGRVRDAWRARSFQGEANHVTGDVHYLTYFLNRRRTVLTVHDCSPLTRKKGIARFLMWLLWYWLPLKRSALVTVVSISGRSDLMANVRIDPSRIRLVPATLSPAFTRAPATFNSARPRILQVGTGWNKNLETVVAAIRDMSCTLAIVGPLSNVQRAMLAASGIEYENMVGLSDAELVGQYKLADMLVFASRYEGFGLPIVEANAVGRPVITSNISSMPEVAGNAACLVDPYDVKSVRAGIERIIADPAYRETLVGKGFDNAKRFLPETVAAQYAEIYRELAASR